jgi:DNA-directed RNA polymerase specialized sigma24 family protein
MQRHPDQYRKAARREARRKDPDGSKAAAWAETRAAARRRLAETEIRQARNDDTRKLIFKLRDEGMSYDDIARTLAGRGIPTMRPSGVQWNKGTIWNIINGSDVRR